MHKINPMCKIGGRQPQNKLMRLRTFKNPEVQKFIELLHLGLYSSMLFLREIELPKVDPMLHFSTNHQNCFGSAMCRDSGCSIEQQQPCSLRTVVVDEYNYSHEDLGCISRSSMHTSFKHFTLSLFHSVVIT